MRILILSHMYPNRMHPNNGIFIHQQIKHLVKSGIRVRVIAPIPYAPKIIWFKQKWKSYGQISRNDMFEGIPVYYPRYLALPGTWYHSLTCYSMYFGIRKSVETIIKEFNPQIIHSHAATYDGYVALILRKKYNLPMVCSLRGSDIHTYPFYERFTKYLTKKVISEADYLTSVSTELKKTAMSLASPKKDIRVLYNGCDVLINSSDRKLLLKHRNDLRIEGNDNVVIFIGSLQEDKGIFELMDSFGQLSRKRHDLHLIIIGEGPEYKSITDIINSRKLSKKIHILGRQPHQAIFNWLQLSDLLVMPSHYEGLPNVVLEAMACRLPVIGTKVGGIPEAVIDGESGILISKKNAEQLSQAIEYILDNKEVAVRMGSRGRSIVEQYFSWSHNTEELVNIYSMALNEKN